MWLHGSKWANACVPGTSIQWGTRACRDVLVENSGRSPGIMVFLFFPTRTHIFLARSRSMCTRCVLVRASCGAHRQGRKTPYTLICGMTTLSQPNSTQSPENLAALPRLPRDEGGPVFAEPWQAQAFALAVKLS